MDNQQREQEALNSQEQQERSLLEEQLNEAIAAAQFPETAPGKLWIKLATQEITRLTREITSEKYRKDHVGYNNALSDLLAYKTILRKMQVAGAPQRREKIEERLEQENGE